MTTYVRFHCAGLILYLQADRVLGVTASPGGDHQSMTQWQDRTITRVVLREALEIPRAQPGHPDHGVVVSHDDGPVMLVVDTVDRVEPVDDEAFQALPPVSGTLHAFFDAASPLSDTGGIGLRLRSPLPDQLFHEAT